MGPLKTALFKEIRIKFKESEKLDDELMNKLVFHHPESLRLSKAGFAIVKSIFDAYVFEIPATMKSRHQFGMSKMEYPYFITRTKLVVFSEMDAMMIKLHGGIEGFLETYSKVDN